jgi:hypothetical protein
MSVDHLLTRSLGSIAYIANQQLQVLHMKNPPIPVTSSQHAVSNLTSA